MKNYKNLTNQVEHILNNFLPARDSDPWLTLKIWSVYYPELVDKSDPANPTVHFQDILKKLPREDNIKRIRAHFQNDKKMYLPTTLAVAKQRKFKEVEWRSLMSNEYKRL